MNTIDIILIVAIAAILAFAGWMMFRRRGKSSCHGGCAGCKYNGNCSGTGESDQSGDNK